MATFTSQVSNALPQWFPGSNDQDRVRNLALLVAGVTVTAFAIAAYNNRSSTPRPVPARPIAARPIPTPKPLSTPAKTGTTWRSYAIGLIATVALGGYAYLEIAKQSAPGAQPRHWGEDSEKYQARVWNQTIVVARAGSYEVGEETVSLQPNNTMNYCLAKNDQLHKMKPYPNAENTTEIKVTAADPFDLAVTLKKLKKLDLYPAVIMTRNDADKLLYQRTTMPWLTTNNTFSAPQGVETIYLPKVDLFREGPGAYYAYKETRDVVDVIYADAYRINISDKNIEFSIYAQLETAYRNGRNAIIIPPSVCETFKDDPQRLADLYTYVINNYFRGTFCQVVFTTNDNTAALKKILAQTISC